jgi:fatty-acyl-CoA synthase
MPAEAPPPVAPFPEPATLSAALERAAADPTAGLRLLDRRRTERWLGWEELALRARHGAGALRAAGVEPGDRVALVHPTGEEFFVAFFAVLAAGAAPVPLPPPTRLGRTAAHARRTLALARAAGARRLLAPENGCVLLGEPADPGDPGEMAVSSLAALPEAPPRDPFPARPDDLALVQLSSGTTADPRPVALSHRALLVQAAILNGFWPDDDTGEPPTALSWLPLFHDMGLIGCVLPALTRPSVLTLLPPELFAARPATWLRALSDTRATISPAPGFAFAHVLERVRDDDLEGVDLSAWKAALVGAEPVSPAVLDAFAERFEPYGLRREALTPVYGLAEAALAVTFSDLDAPYRAPGFDLERLGCGEAVPSPSGRRLVSVGRPVPGFEVAVLPPGDRPGTPEPAAGSLPAGRVGRVWLRGPSLMTGYLDRPEATGHALVHGWLDSGDLGFLHDGELYLTGRAKDLLILRGRNHAPHDLERAALAAAGAPGGRRVLEAAVAVSRLPDDDASVGAPGTGREELWLLLERRRHLPDADLGKTAASCRQAVLEETGLPPDHLVIVEAGALPRTSSGKLRRAEALTRLLAGDLPVVFGKTAAS